MTWINWIINTVDMERKFLAVTPFSWRSLEYYVQIYLFTVRCEMEFITIFWPKFHVSSKTMKLLTHYIIIILFFRQNNFDAWSFLTNCFTFELLDSLTDFYVFLLYALKEDIININIETRIFIKTLGDHLF